MAEITPARNNIHIEEVRYKSSISEATGFKLGAAINHINTKQYDSKTFCLNGPYYYPGPGIDGPFIAQNNCQIIGISMYNLIAGTSGTTTLDLKLFTDANTPVGGTSIFGTKPAISYTAGNYAWLHYDFLNSTTLKNPAGTTIPTLNISTMNAGDMLLLTLVGYQEGAKHCGLIVYTRPT